MSKPKLTKSCRAEEEMERNNWASQNSQRVVKLKEEDSRSVDRFEPWISQLPWFLKCIFPTDISDWTFFMQFSSPPITCYVSANPVVLSLITLITSVGNKLRILLSRCCPPQTVTLLSYQAITSQLLKTSIHFPLFCLPLQLLPFGNIHHLRSVGSKFFCAVLLAIIRVSQPCQMCNILFPVSQPTRR